MRTLAFLPLLATAWLAAPAAGFAQAAPSPARVPFIVRATDTLAVRGAASAAGRDAATTAFDVDGLRVIVRQNAANDVVAANLYLLGGTQQLTPATQGIEALLLAASERGTARYSRDALRRALARTGSTITIDPEKDWTLVSLRTVRAELDSSWNVLADRLLAPRLDSSEVELVRTQLVNAARQQQATPDAQLARIADSVLFAGHPYALLPEGSPASLAGITLGDLRAYHARQMVKSRLLLVVVGNVTPADVERLVRPTIGRLPQGNYQWRPPAPRRVDGGATIVSRGLPTNYILGYYTGPAATHRDYAALRVASAVLSGTLFGEIRSRHKLTYAVDAPFIERAFATGGVYVTTVAPDTTLALMRQELDLMRTELLDPAALTQLVQRFITDYFLRNETNADQASFLARAELYAGDYRTAADFVNALRQVTAQDIRRVTREYMRDFTFVYLGDPARVQVGRLERF